MEQYCITLQQAKRLSELGFDEGSDFFWQEEIAYPENAVLIEGKEIPIGIDASAFNIYPAYHVGELGDILRDWVLDIDPEFIEGDKVWFITNNEVPRQVHPTEAQARGALLIHLIENKLI